MKRQMAMSASEFPPFSFPSSPSSSSSSSPFFSSSSSSSFHPHSPIEVDTVETSIDIPDSSKLDIVVSKFNETNSQDEIIFGLGHFKSVSSVFTDPEMFSTVMLFDISEKTLRFLDTPLPSSEIAELQIEHMLEKMSRFNLIKLIEDKGNDEGREDESEAKAKAKGKASTSKISLEVVRHKSTDNSKILISYDTPFQQHRGKTYHTDSISSKHLPFNTKKLINDKYVKSDYTLIEYTNDCISTTIRIPEQPSGIIRFLACPGTVMCIENQNQKHTGPYHSGESRRSMGDEILNTQVRANVTRQIYRMTVTFISDADFERITQIQSQSTIITIPDEILKEFVKPSFHVVSLDKYLRSYKYLEHGGKHKNKSKRRQNKRRQNKSKRNKYY